MIPQHLAGGLQKGAVGDDALDALVFDLGDLDGGVPGRHQRRGADDRAVDFSRKRVHVVAENCPLIGIGIVVEVTLLASELVFERLQQVMAIRLERVFVGQIRRMISKPGSPPIE